MLVRDIMTPEPIVAEVPGTRESVLRLLVKHAVTGLPVVKAGTRELAGVVTRSDVFRRPRETQLALVMTQDPATITPDVEVTAAAALLHARGIHTLPVVEDGKLVGVVTPTDVLRTMGDSMQGTVKEHATGAVAPVFEETPLPAVWQIMQLSRQNALPVIDGAGNLAGIVAVSDLFRRSGVEERIGQRELGFSRDEEEWLWANVRDIAPVYYAASVVDLPFTPVREICVRDVVTVFEGTSVVEAARKMVRHRVNQLPVVRADDRLAGLVTDLDLMRGGTEA